MSEQSRPRRFLEYPMVIDWLQWSEFPEKINEPSMAQVTLTLISEYRSYIAKLEQENKDLELQNDFIKQYLNPADTSFRKMIDTFAQLNPEQKEKIINLTKALKDVEGVG